MLNVRRVPVAELAADEAFAALTARYEEECGLTGLLRAAPALDAYAELERKGAYQALAAYVDGRLAGFCGVIFSAVPHYEGAAFASVESLFVDPGSRKSGAGLALIREAERLAAERGAPVLFMSAPAGGRLDVLLPRLGYRRTNVVYMKERSRAC